MDLQKERLAKLEELAAQEAEADQRHKDRQRAKAARTTLINQIVLPSNEPYHIIRGAVAARDRGRRRRSEAGHQRTIAGGGRDRAARNGRRIRKEGKRRAQNGNRKRGRRAWPSRDLGGETFRELDPQYEVEARKRVEADVARAPVRNARLTDRKNERAEHAQKLCDRQKVFASDLRRHSVEKTMFSELDQARDKRLEKATKARTTAEASMEATRARLAEVRETHAASMKRRDACVSAAGRLRDVGGLIQRTRDSACRRRARALALSAALERCAQERETRDALARATKSEEEIEEAEAAAAAASSSDSDSRRSGVESYSGSSVRARRRGRGRCGRAAAALLPRTRCVCCSLQQRPGVQRATRVPSPFDATRRDTLSSVITPAGTVVAPIHGGVGPGTRAYAGGAGVAADKAASAAPPSSLLSTSPCFRFRRDV